MGRVDNGLQSLAKSRIIKYAKRCDKRLGKKIHNYKNDVLRYTNTLLKEKKVVIMYRESNKNIHKTLCVYKEFENIINCIEDKKIGIKKTCTIKKPFLDYYKNGYLIKVMFEIVEY